MPHYKDLKGLSKGDQKILHRILLQNHPLQRMLGHLLVLRTSDPFLEILAVLHLNVRC